MPFVRFSRDKRGYEYLYLIHVPAGNGGRGSAGRPRVLYWYRTPPGVKVGREPFDPPLRAALEAQNPDVAFDWKKIMEAQAPPPPEAEPWRERRRAERSAKQAARSAALRDEEPAAIAQPASIDSVVVEIEGGDRDVTAAAQPEEPPGMRDATPVPSRAGDPESAVQPAGRRRRRGGRHRRRSGDVPGSPETGAGDPTPSSDASHHDLQPDLQPGGTSPSEQPGETRADTPQADENQASENAADAHQPGENVDETDAPWRSS